MSGRLRPLVLARELAACVRAHWQAGGAPAAAKPAMPALPSEPDWKEKILARTIWGVRTHVIQPLGLHVVELRLDGRKPAHLSLRSWAPIAAQVEGECTATCTSQPVEGSTDPWTIGYPDDYDEVVELFDSAWSGASICSEYYDKREWRQLSNVLGRLGYFKRDTGPGPVTGTGTS